MGGPATLNKARWAVLSRQRRTTWSRRLADRRCCRDATRHRLPVSGHLSNTTELDHACRWTRRWLAQVQQASVVALARTVWLSRTTGRNVIISHSARLEVYNRLRVDDNGHDYTYNHAR